MKSDDGCMSTYCPRKTSRSTQHPSDFPVSVVDQNEIFGLTRIFHTDRDEEAAKADGARRAMKSDDGCMSTYCPRKTSRSTQHPSDFPAYAGDQDEIPGLKEAPPMSRRYCFPSKLIKSVAAYAFLRASSSVSPSAVTPRTRPPAV